MIATLADEVAALERVFDAALAAALPNPVALTFTDLRLGYQGKRDLVFALDLLDEGENEAALIAGLARDAAARDPAFEGAHLVREAWYYLRTSIDPDWQFGEEPETFGIALAYVGRVLEARLAIAARETPRSHSDMPPPRDRRALLEQVRTSDSRRNDIPAIRT